MAHNAFKDGYSDFHPIDVARRVTNLCLMPLEVRGTTIEGTIPLAQMRPG